MWFGNGSHHFDVKLNRLLIGSKGLGMTTDLHPDVAFVKGIEWFTEVFIFYGLLFAIAGYEMSKAASSSEKTKQTIESLVVSKKEHSQQFNALRKNLEEQKETNKLLQVHVEATVFENQ